MTCAFVRSITMRQPLPTHQLVQGVDLHGEPAHVKVDVYDDGRIVLTNSTSRDEPVVLSAEQTARLRNQLGEALTAALRDPRTTREPDAS